MKTITLEGSGAAIRLNYDIREVEGVVGGVGTKNALYSASDKYITGERF